VFVADIHDAMYNELYNVLLCDLLYTDNHDILLCCENVTISCFYWNILVNQFLMTNMLPWLILHK